MLCRRVDLALANHSIASPIAQAADRLDRRRFPDQPELSGIVTECRKRVRTERRFEKDLTIVSFTTTAAFQNFHCRLQHEPCCRPLFREVSPYHQPEGINLPRSHRPWHRLARTRTKQTANANTITENKSSVNNPPNHQTT